MTRDERDELVSEIGRCRTGEALLDLVADRLPPDPADAWAALEDLAKMVGWERWEIPSWLAEHDSWEERQEWGEEEGERPAPLVLTARGGGFLGFALRGVRLFDLPGGDSLYVP